MKWADPSADLDMAQTYLVSRFRIDSCQRLEAGMISVPRFVLLRTRLGCLWRFRSDSSPETIRELAKLAGREGTGVAPFEVSPPPERVEPILRVLRRAGGEVAAIRDLLVHRVDCVAALKPGPVALFRIDAAESEDLCKASLARAQMGSISFGRRRALAQLDASQWICFGDLITFVDVELD